MKIPIVTEEYWDLVNNVMELKQGLDGLHAIYGLEQRRILLHQELSRYYGLEHNVTKSITDNMDKLKSAKELHYKLLKMKKTEANDD